MVGADPEFFILQPPDRPVYNQAPNQVQALIPGAGGIGADHNGRVWELRPTPHQSTYQVVVNLWKLLKSKEMEKVSAFKWKSGGIENYSGINDTIGGHVHFGFPAFPAGGLQRMADTTVALEKLDILPEEESKSRRDWNDEYGDLYGTRVSGGHIEYRAPASWLDKPGQALAVLTTYKLAARLPKTLEWTKSKQVKADFQNWLAALSQKDIDAWLLYRLLEKRNFTAIQADPKTDFRPQWRKEEDLWR